MYDEIGVKEVFRCLASYMARFGGTLTLCLRHETRGVMLAGTGKIAVFLDIPAIGEDGSLFPDDAPGNDDLHLFGGDRDWRVPGEAETWKKEMLAAFEAPGIRVTEAKAYGPAGRGPNNEARGWDFRIEKTAA